MEGVCAAHIFYESEGKGAEAVSGLLHEEKKKEDERKSLTVSPSFQSDV